MKRKTFKKVVGVAMTIIFGIACIASVNDNIRNTRLCDVVYKDDSFERAIEEAL